MRIFVHVDVPDGAATIDCTEHSDSWDVEVRDRHGRRRACFAADRTDPVGVLYEALHSIYG